MPLPDTLNDREHRKFAELINGQTAVIVTEGDVAPNNRIKSNPSLAFNYNGSVLLSVVKTINGNDYTKTYSHDGSGNLTVISDWA